ncbi:protein of unknown function [Marinobacter gudaonensis]|uniref:DUF4399 domain-containing protein n=1 Tax=Marinobacter gudaonensis TaxID=375760 RepID=A0A1I6G6M4_9GAMM|nr:DUF4399 domain-containing protein [Marinobacter gudaonensis]SFR37848.1 protein of unknown function [Marinobacter gudaonensis]
MNRIAIALCSALMVAPVAAIADAMKSEAPANAEVYFVQPSDGATVGQTFKVVFGLRNMGVAPAGIDKAGTGHHHLLIDTDVPSDMSQSLPATDQVRHFGGGQTETEVTLAPGKHTLQLLLGNHAHVPHEPAVVSKKITVTVE